MEIALGFIIAVFIAITGVGAGSMTTPLLILLLGMPTKQAVGTALIFGAAVKILTTPLYIARKQVNWRAFGFLMATGLPGVLIGTLLLQGFKSDLLTAFVGFTIVSIATINLLRFSNVTRHDRTPWLAAVGLPIGIEVGFSSAGAGALGALCLMNMTMLAPAAVVGTDLSFGLVLSLVGGGIHAALGDLNTPVLIKLLIGGAAGALAGGLLASRLPSKKLRFVLCVALVILGANLGWKGWSDYRKDAASESHWKRSRSNFQHHRREQAPADAYLKLMPPRPDLLGQPEIHLESLRLRIGAEKLPIAHREGLPPTPRFHAAARLLPESSSRGASRCACRPPGSSRR